MEKTIKVSSNDIEIIEASEYLPEISDHFREASIVAQTFIGGAKKTYAKIEKMLYSATAFVNAVKAAVPTETFQAVLSNEQKLQIAKGALKLMTKKDGSLMANLINPETKKIVSTISLKKIKLTPEMSQAMTSYATQMQMAQIAEQIQKLQVAIEEIRQGQEYDRLATAYSCQQKLLQAMAIKNPQLKSEALLRIALDAEDSRNLLMLSQSANVAFIRNQPETFWGKLRAGAPPEKINLRMNEIRESLLALNMVSLAEAIAYQEMGEPEAAQLSLQYYADYINRTYLASEGLVNRLDMIDPSPKNYWSKSLPDIERRIKALPWNDTINFLGESENETEEM